MMMREKVVVHIGGMHCAMCVNTLTEALSGVDGVLSVSINLATEKALIEYEPEKVDIQKIRAVIEETGYQFLGTEEQEVRAGDTWNLLYRVIAGFGVGLALMLLIMTKPFSGFLFNLLIFIVATPAFLYLAYPIFRAALSALRHRTLNMDVMYAMGTGTSYIASVFATLGILGEEYMFYDAAVLLAAFLMLGRYLEQRAKSRASQSIKALLRLQPKKAVVLRNGKETMLSVEEIVPGDTVIVRAGERVPVDGTVLDGWSYVDEAMLTGEPDAVLKKPGMQVFSGTINKQRIMKIRAEKVGKDTVLARIIKLVEEAQTSKPGIQRIADRMVQYFIPVVFITAVCSFGIWYFVMKENFLFSLSVFISVIVVACPCALGLATPAAVTVGVGRGAELGIFIKNSETLEACERITAVVFDKTGTLTSGTPEVLSMHTYSNDENTVLSAIYALERRSTHPLAVAIAGYAGKRNVREMPLSDYEEVEGKGVRGIAGGLHVIVGSADFLREHGVDVSMASQETQGQSMVYASINGKLACVFAIGDRVREDAASAVKALKAEGLKVIMLTGDNERSARKIAAILGIEHVVADVRADEKADVVKKLVQKGEVVCFVGDGINDAPAIALAHIGIAMGQGTDVAIETGDIVLMKNRIKDVHTAIKLGKKVMQRIRQNIFWAFAYNLVLIPVAAGALYPFLGITMRPEFAALAMALSSLSVLLLSLSLKRFRA